MTTESFTVLNLLDGEPVDMRRYLAGGWRSIQLRRLTAGRQERLAAEGVEHALYVLRGQGSAQVGDRAIDLRPGVALTFPEGSATDVRAGTDELELFVVTLDA
jgi:mannose-6-phosphate isomerase-like protein (cupin superfamily)